MQPVKWESKDLTPGVFDCLTVFDCWTYRTMLQNGMVVLELDPPVGMGQVTPISKFH